MSKEYIICGLKHWLNSTTCLQFLLFFLSFKRICGFAITFWVFWLLFCILYNLSVSKLRGSRLLWYPSEVVWSGYFSRGIIIIFRFLWYVSDWIILRGKKTNDKASSSCIRFQNLPSIKYIPYIKTGWPGFNFRKNELMPYQTHH